MSRWSAAFLSWYNVSTSKKWQTRSKASSSFPKSSSASSLTAMLHEMHCELEGSGTDTQLSCGDHKFMQPDAWTRNFAPLHRPLSLLLELWSRTQATLILDPRIWEKSMLTFPGRSWRHRQIFDHRVVLTQFEVGFFLPEGKTCRGGGGGAKWLLLLTWLFRARWQWNLVGIYYG